MTHRCRDCPEKTFFSLKFGTVMEGSKLPYRVWAIAIYLFTTNIKGVSSMKLHRELGIGQKAAWFLMHRLRKAFETDSRPFSGPVEVDETYVPLLVLAHDGEQGFWLGRRNERVEAETRAHGTGSCARSAAPCRPCAQKAQIRALKCRWVSLGVTWGVPRGALDIVAGQPPPTSSGEPGSLRGVLDDSGMKPVRGACMSR